MCGKSYSSSTHNIAAVCLNIFVIIFILIETFPIRILLISTLLIDS